MIVKALSIHEPWAWLIREGLKKFETRSWKTYYRGPLLICASLRRVMGQFEYGQLLDSIGLFYDDSSLEVLPFGKALCLADFTACWKTVEIRDELTRTELALGDFSDNRFAWQLNAVRICEPFPVRGRQGLFDVKVPDELLKGAA